MRAAGNDQHLEKRTPAESRALGALITLVTTVGTSGAFLFVAWIFATFNCEGSPCPGAGPGRDEPHRSGVHDRVKAELGGYSSAST